MGEESQCRRAFIILDFRRKRTSKVWILFFLEKSFFQKDAMFDGGNYN